MLERISHAAINFLTPINKPKISYLKEETGISTSVYSSVTYGGLNFVCETRVGIRNAQLMRGQFV